MLRRYVEFIVRFRIAVIILVALITVFIGSRIKELKVEVDPDKNLPQSHPYVVAQQIKGDGSIYFFRHPICLPLCLITS